MNDLIMCMTLNHWPETLLVWLSGLLTGLAVGIPYHRRHP